MQPIDYEAEYNNRARVPEHPGLIEGWQRDAAAWRAAAKGDWSVPYGDGPRMTLDVVGDGAGPVAMFVHGGYWMALDRSFFTHMARGLNARGVTLVIPSYDLCPAVGIGDIVEEIRQACVFAWRRFEKPLTVAGHSAGGHLAACMLATDWPALSPDLPAGLVRSAYALSGLFDLAPLVQTSMNATLRLTPEEALRLSPVAWTPPRGLTLDAVVGGAESGEYLRQSRDITDVWGAGGVRTRCEAVEGENHFTVIAPLADPASAMTKRVAMLADQAGLP
jgi:arylformamidase